MGTITTGIGLVSGINTAQLIDGLMAIEARGKTMLQQRIASLTTQRTALLDINARLLNMKNAAKAFRLDRIFQSALAASSNEDILTATAAKGAQPGAFTFIVKQLVSTSQKLTAGYADKSTTPLGLTSLSFELGRGGLATDRDLEQLNAGAGVDRGRITITDRTGAAATIDLRDATTLDEVIERISAASAINVTASVDGDHLVITDDNAGATGTLTVANGAGDTTATDLGIAGTGVGSILTGTNINTVGGATSLASLNDGTGVLTRDNVADFTITARDGTVLNVELGRLDLPITATTKLADLNNGTGVTIGDDDNKDIKFIARDGTAHEVNLTGVTTVAGLIDRVTVETGGKILISIHADGERLVVTDTTGATASNLQVLGAGDNANDTAEDLGILNAAGVAAASFDGQIIPNTISDPAASTLQDVIDRISGATGNGGKIAASIAADGVSLLITDTTGGAGNLIIRRTAANPQAAGALGIETGVAGVAASSVDGRRLVAALGSVLVGNLNGGDGLGGATTISITDRSGAAVSLTNLNTFDSLSEIMTHINQQAALAGVDVSVGINDAGNGVQVTDASGGAGDLIVAGDAAVALAIDGTVAANTIRGDSLQHRYVSEATALRDLNYGRGIGTGSFRITDGLGDSAVVNIGADSQTLYDIIAEINSRGLAINARVNDRGDGLLIEAALDVGETPVVKLKIESVSGSTAKDLNIIGTSAAVENAVIDGSYERTVALDAADSLDDVVSKVNDAGIPVSASIINAGGGATPYRINFTSGVSGRVGDLIIDPGSGAIGLGLTTLTPGRDAKVFFGSDDPASGLLVTSSSNSIDTILDGVTLDLHKASDEAVTVTVTRDTASITEAVKQLVTTFNDAIARINEYDFFDVDSQAKGVLLGNSTTARVREALYRALQQRAENVEGQYQFLRQVGITVGTDGQLKLDQAKFDAAYASDPESVENLFATFEATPAGTEEVLPGITIQQSEQNVTARGFGDLFDDLLDTLTNSIDGWVTLADRSFNDQIKLANKRIGEMDVRLEAKRKRLEAEFAAMETALARLQAQGNALNSLAANVFLAQTSGVQ
jgi:flagellar hook-associated protein 2